ncbi:MAG: hypothetical protein ABFD79_03255, partial [Phycisphaerales bacterium]
FGTGKTTVDMMAAATYLEKIVIGKYPYERFEIAGWDFVDETTNGTEDIWKIREGTNYPDFAWQNMLGDLAWPNGIDFIDYSVLANQWQLEKLSFDTVPNGGDGIVNFLDLAAFAQNWHGDYEQLFEFSSQWLMRGMYNADIAPTPADGIVDFKDFALLAKNWLKED